MNWQETLNQVKHAIRAPFAWPGGYPVYTVMADGGFLCPKCARSEYKLIARATRDGYENCWIAIGAEVYWEVPTELCVHCQKPVIESAYGDPDESESES